jgi:hypothetical protein
MGLGYETFYFLYLGYVTLRLLCPGSCFTAEIELLSTGEIVIETEILEGRLWLLP